MSYATINSTLGAAGQPRRRRKPAPSYPTAVLQQAPPSSAPHTTVVTSGSHTPVVTRIAGQEVAPRYQPTLPDYIGSPSSYLNTADELRAKYLGGPDGGTLAKTPPKTSDAEQALKAALQGLDGPQARLAPYAVQAARKTGVPASVLLALSGQESGYGTNEGPSSAGAQGATQFIPSTRQTIIDKYGVDPWKNDKSGLLAAGLYLNDLGFNQDPQAALSSYSGGYAASDYNNPILTNARNFTALDKAAGTAGPVSAPAPPHQLATNELFYDPGTSLKDNQPIAPIGGHSDHVHFGSENQRDLLTAAKVAERLGLDVRENPLFDPVDPVHVSNSMHYDTEQLKPQLQGLAQRLGGTGDQIGAAIDLSGPASAMARYDEIIARRSGAAISPSSGPGATAMPTLTGSGAPVTTGSVPSVAARRRQAQVPSFGPPIQNPLAAGPVLPDQQGASTLTDLLNPASTSDPSQLATVLERFRPQRRL